MKSILVILLLILISTVWSQTETNELIMSADVSLSEDSDLKLILPYATFELEKEYPENTLRLEFDGQAGLVFEDEFNISFPLIVNPRLKTPLSDIIDGELNLELKTLDLEFTHKRLMLGAEYSNLMEDIKAISDWAEFERGVEIDTYFSTNLEDRIAWNFDIEYSYYNGLYFFMFQPKARYIRPLETDPKPEFFLSLYFVKDFTRKIYSSFYYILDTGKSSTESIRRFELHYLASDKYEYITYAKQINEIFEFGLRFEYLIFD
jgi:hypothetical protein